MTDFSAAQQLLLAKTLQSEGIFASNVSQPVKRRQLDSNDVPLSFAQERLWFLEQLAPGTAAYNIPVAVRLVGKLDVAALEASLAVVVGRHEALRTSFPGVDGGPVQRVALPGVVPVERVDLQSAPGRIGWGWRRVAGGAGGRLMWVLGRWCGQCCSFWRGTIMCCLLRCIIWWLMVGDRVLLRELGELYSASVSGRPSGLPELVLQYPDVAVWQRRWLQGEVRTEQLEYWRRQLEGAPARLELWVTGPGRLCSGLGWALLVRVDVSVVVALRGLAQGEGVTLFMTLLAAFQTLLGRYAGQTDVVVGSPVAGRVRTEFEPLIGCFVNTLVLRTDLGGNPTFRQLLGRVRETCLGAYAHQDLPFELLVEALQPERSLSHTPLFQVMFALQPARARALELPGVSVEDWPVDRGAAQCDLTLTLEEGEDGLRGALEYNTDLFEASTVARLAQHLGVLLEAIARDPDGRVGELPLLSPGERQQVLVEWNATQVSYPTEVCVHELVAVQAARSPDAVAVVFEGQAMSYRELDVGANQLAHELRSRGWVPRCGSRCVWSGHRSWWWLCWGCSRPVGLMFRWIRGIRPIGWRSWSAMRRPGWY